MTGEDRIPVESEPRPICPHCRVELTEVVDLRNPGPRTDFMQVVHLVVCPTCRKVLGASVNSETFQR